ncbi:YgfZ/GcvT domain-containing protein [Thalassobius sp. MITS945101]|uniref:CAF17-like 4Fe-4S cluster assembly/insertion protein YgfZ n=1 Tax=Thalassobius sp. MITS945101 TaxID=3096994 RepID=UPI00399A81B7
MSRSIFRLSGEDTRDFLQGLVTNDVTRLDEGLVYAALLTPQGKYLADFFLVPDGADVLLDVDASLAAMLLPRLTMYKLRAKVTIESTELQVKRGTGAQLDGAFADPRHSALGWRLYGTESGDDGSDWEAIRVAHCIPQTGVELGPDTFILEAGFEALNGVDFRKGCYVGQEVTARMKHKTELRKGLARVAIEGDAATGDKILSGEKEAGVLHSRAGNEAIAYLRYDRAKGEMTAGAAKITRL